jgi:hypothetical protein
MSFKRGCRRKALLGASRRASKTRNKQRKNLMHDVRGAWRRHNTQHDAAEMKVRSTQHKYPVSEAPSVMSHVARLSRSLWRSWSFHGRPTTSARSVPPRWQLWAGPMIAAIAPLAACAAASGPRAEYPHSEAICQYVGLESVETPQQTDTDSSSFVAVYRFREPHDPAPEQPVKLKFQVNRSRVAELQTHLESQPEVVCSPDNDRHWNPRVKPLPEPPSLEPMPPASPTAQGSQPGSAFAPPEAAPATAEPAPAVGPGSTAN